MELGQLVWVGLGCFLLYMMLFHPEKVERANKMGRENMEHTGKVLSTVGQTGWTVFKLFKR